MVGVSCIEVETYCCYHRSNNLPRNKFEFNAC